MNEYLRRAWAEIDLDRLGRNLGQLETLAGGTQICCVVKANAYGHDDRSIAPYLEGKGITFFAVSNIKEALTLRECGVKGEILILGHTPYEYAAELSEEAIIQTAVSVDYARRMSEYADSIGVKVHIHLAVDTGMGRIGVRAEEAPGALKEVSALDGVILDGMFTHFACADSYDSDDIAYTEEQKRLFFEAADKAAAQGIRLRHIHCLNSAGGTFRYDDRSTLVRFGIMLYGLTPDRGLDMPVELLPVMDLKAAVSYVKKVPAGRFISYGRTFRAERDMTVATVPIGYADGYPRELSNKAYVLINGMRAPVIGRVCMDQLMADVTDIPDVHEGSEVTLIGKSGDESITADDLAELCGTIGYEIVCGISKRVPRVIIEGGRIISVREYY
ncbi:MAG: alanine racemase [Oscillospiraceae bacterium]|nr:alanine racemase [Oscillospiraceae bacterium]